MKVSAVVLAESIAFKTVPKVEVVLSAKVTLRSVLITVSFPKSVSSNFIIASLGETSSPFLLKNLASSFKRPEELKT